MWTLLRPRCTPGSATILGSARAERVRSRRNKMEDSQATDLIARALAVTKAANTPDALLEVAFTSALALLAGSPVQGVPAGTVGGGAAVQQAQQPPPNSNGHTVS